MEPDISRIRKREISAIAAAFVLAGISMLSGKSSGSSDSSSVAASQPAVDFNYDYYVHQPRDTIYVADTCFLEVRLDSQSVFEHCRSGFVRRFPCSSGNLKIPKAIGTTEGIYTIQTKVPLAISKQFDSTKMYYWVGFNGNIGFHGLDGKQYYRFLGKRPSSHGCVRLSQEDAEWLFKNIALGTPVIVDSGNAARCLQLVDSVPAGCVHIGNTKEVRRGLYRQLLSLYRGRYFIEKTPRYFFKNSRLWWGGISTGNAQAIAKRQLKPYIYDVHIPAQANFIPRAAETASE